MSDKLSQAMADAMRALTEAEALSYAAGMRSTIGASLVTAHSPLLKAMHDYAAQERRRAA